MMLKTEYYYRNLRGIYRSRLINYLGFWVLALNLFLAVISLVHAFLSFDFIASIHAAALLASLVVTVVWLAVQVVNVFKFKGVRNYLHARAIACSIRRSLLNTMSLNRSKDAPQRVQVPGVAVRLAPLPLTIIIDKLAGMYDVDRLIEDVNSSLRGHYRNYGVTTAIVEDNGLHYVFNIEDVGTDRTYRPRTIDELIKPKYEVELQQGLTINLAKNPHIILFGASGSGKTSTLFAILAQLLGSGTDVRIIDGKQEFSSLTTFYPKEKVVTDIADVLAMLDDILKELERRQKVMADAVTRKQVFGLKGFDIGLTPIVVMADEVGSIIAGLDNKQKKQLINDLIQIVQKGRSVSIFLVFATQSPATTVLPQDIRSQFSTRILLASASGDVQRMAFNGMTATDGGVEKFTGYYISDGKTIQPMKYYVPNLITHNLNNLQTLEQLYNYGKNHK